MILETKQDKSKGCQVTNAIQFEDYVLLKNRKHIFKLALESKGIVLYQEQADKSWAKITKSNDDMIEHLKTREQEQQAQIQQFKDRMALEQAKTANLVSLVKHIQEQLSKHTAQIKDLSLQLQNTLIQQQQTPQPSESSCVIPIQSEPADTTQSVQQIELPPYVTLVIGEPPLTKTEQTIQVDSQIDLKTITDSNEVSALQIDSIVPSLDLTLQNKDDIQLVQATHQDSNLATLTDSSTIQQGPVVEIQPVSVVQQSSKVPINKTFTVKAQVPGQDYIVLQCKEDFSIPTLPSKVTCRHIRQFFDLVVVDMNTELRQLLVRPDAKLNNKQTIYILESQ